MPTADADRVTVTELGPPLPDAAFRVVNPVLSALLRSPLHGLVSDGILLVTFTGRLSGETYSTPVGYHGVDVAPGRETPPDLLAFNDGGWWRNPVDGAAVELMLRGERVDAVATARSDGDATAEYLHALLAEHGPGYARRLGIAVDGDRVPTVAELADGIEEKTAIELDLEAGERHPGDGELGLEGEATTTASAGQ